MEENAIHFVLNQIKSQIVGFTDRRKSLERKANILQNSNIISGTLSVFSLSLNLKYPGSSWAIAALGFSTAAVIGHQLLQHYRFQDRLRIAIVTTAQLKALQTKMEFCRLQSPAAIDAEVFLGQFQSILDEANAAWRAQLAASMSESGRATNELPKIEL